MIYAIKKQNESNERLISRFKKVVQRSRVLMNAKQHRYHEQPKRKRYTRLAAVKRDFYRSKRAKEQFYSS
ncbi:30S ribosomal protein S21 [Candidatus Peregrinibacteria bacterium]|nr:30S ribosomal protein S21 [Candidatus Peregrinibacteria bacterium]